MKTSSGYAMGFPEFPSEVNCVEQCEYKRLSPYQFQLYWNPPNPTRLETRNVLLPAYLKSHCQGMP